ncbi:putative Phosphatase 2C family protein [Tripterygium wilfordii]|uniref:protein-serine/threonine phosphatase n=1 Tax=Tripterygium wilfordii TaxID=458696 RepID=A0A7J7BYL8_TRIWF|nr:putative Phosphatase 2C family protein [Tripterygium wilfordii]
MNQKPTEEVSSTVVVSCSLKRKRPPKIEIPNVLQEIRADRLKLKELTPKNDAVCFGGVGVGVSSVKGKKKFMEDTYRIFSCLQGNSNKRFFGVYDGHGGKKASEFVAENLHSNILEMIDNCTGDAAKVEAVKAGYLKTDQEFLKQGIVSGACCVTALIEGKKAVISNLGDCRAVLCRGGLAEALTIDHKAERVDERERIEKKGGYVEIHRGAWRVHGILSVSRSIGDAHLKDWVLAEPETKILQLTPDMEFIVLASDGLWEEVCNQEAVDVVTRLCFPGKKIGCTGVSLKDENDDYGHVNASPLSKIRRISLVKQHKGSSPSPSHKRADGWKASQNDYANENESPPSKIRKVSFFQQRKGASQSPNDEKVDSWKDSGDDYASENEIPPSNSRRISMVNRKNMKMETLSQENLGCKKTPASEGLVAASKELVNLAISRGSLDDITVMIIDLNHFRCNN